MSDKPTFPEDAAVGTHAAKTTGERSAAPGGNEPEADPRRKKYMKAGVAVGIGSAAIVAALLYANRGKRNDKGNS